jgi:RimJ/RimL family protein N-acetyltransferase
LLPPYWGRGYAFEAASAALAQGRGALGRRRIVAITSLENERSIHLLGRLGFRLERVARFTEGGEELRLFALDA